MKIAFDMDGVLRDGRLGFYMLCRDLNSSESKRALDVETMASCNPLLNPMLFATKEDEIFAVTNISVGQTAQQKKDWLNHFYGNRLKFLCTEVPDCKGERAYVDTVSKLKIKLMLKEGIQVYFDNDPMIVKIMRTLTDKITILKYGTWVEEYY